MTFSDRLRYQRKLSGMTQKELAAKLGVAYQMIQRYENGMRSPKLETVARFADALGCTPDELYGDEQLALINIHDAIDRHDGVALSQALGGAVQFVNRVETVREAELMLAFRELTEDQQDAVLTIVRGMRS